MENNIVPIMGYGQEILRKTCLEADNDEKSKLVMANLMETMLSIKSAVGLAANQINSDLRIFAAKIQGINEIVVNPVILKRRQSYSVDEGCLSIPGVNSKGVVRDKIIEVEYYNHEFNRVRKKLSNYDAVVFQHEYDHLCGILYIDRLDDKNMAEIKHKLNNIKKSSETLHYHIVWPNEQVVNK